MTGPVLIMEMGEETTIGVATVKETEEAV